MAHGRADRETVAQVVGVGAYLPGDPVTNAQIEELVGPLPDGLLGGMRMERRHWIVDRTTGKHRESNSDMAAKATAQALERAGLEPAELDLLIVSTATPDYLLPPMSSMVQDKLGLSRCAVLDIRSGGAGVVQGLDIARSFIERGTYRTAAVVGSDAISPLQAQMFANGERRLRVRDRLVTYMFGDGAATIVLRAGEVPGIVGAATACIGTGRPPGMQVLGVGGSYAPIHEQLANGRPMDLKIDIPQATTFTATLMFEGMRDALRTTGVSADSIDLLVTPEADADWMVEATGQGADVPAEWEVLGGKIYNVLPESGAPGCAALPLGLERAWTTGRLLPGDRVLLLGMETTKWIYAGMVVDWTAPPLAAAEAR